MPRILLGFQAWHAGGSIHPSAGRAQGFHAFLLARAIHHLPSPARRLLGHRFWAKEGGDRCWLRVWFAMFFEIQFSSPPRDISLSSFSLSTAIHWQQLAS